TGYFAAWIRLAYDLFTVRDTGGLKEELKTRLLYGKSFQGARHELRVASVCVAAGFSLKYEDDADGSRKHPEFVGTHSTLGYKIAVEAKSRHRFGVNGFIGGKDVPPGKSVGVRDLVLAAYKKDVDVPLYVFVDANLPPSPDAQTSTRWQDEIEKTMMDLAAEGYTDPNPANAVFFTNDPSHYYGNDVVSAGAGDSWTQKFVATTPKWPHPEDDVVARIQKAINTRAAPPSKFFEEAGPLEKAIRAQDRRTEGGA
ncbi:MAG: hypothetical protein Q7V53_03175, partial [Caldisericota bacterium]|nr:hypothetical protein [Caldisericota bacterium]